MVEFVLFSAIAAVAAGFAYDAFYFGIWRTLTRRRSRVRVHAGEV